MATETAQAARGARETPSAGVTARLIRYFKAQTEDWYDECRQLTNWEDAQLVDNPLPEKLIEHARLLNELERVGRWLFQTTRNEDFPDRATADLVSMTLQDLKDRRAM